MALFSPGLVSISFRKLSPEEILAAVASTPLKGIEWGGDVHVPHGDFKRAETVGRMTSDADLEAFCYGSYYRFREINPEADDKAPSIKCVLDTAEALGSQRIRLWTGESDYEMVTEKWIQSVAAHAHEIGELAAKRDLQIDLEFHGGTLNNSPQHSHELLKAINHPNVHTLWQPLNSIPVKNRADGLKALLPHVSNIHCYQWGPKGFHDRRALEEGKDEWSDYLKIMASTGDTRWISLEYVKGDSLDQLQADSETLSRWVQSACK